MRPKVCPNCNSPYWDKPKWKGLKKSPKGAERSCTAREESRHDLRKLLFRDGLQYAIHMTRLSYARLCDDLVALSSDYWSRRDGSESLLPQEHDVRRLSALSQAWEVVDSMNRLRELLRDTPGIKHDAQYELFMRKTKDVESLRDVIQHLNGEIVGKLIYAKIPAWGRLSWVWKPQNSDHLVQFIFIPGELFGSQHELVNPAGKSFTLPIGLVTISSSVQVCLSAMVGTELPRVVRMVGTELPRVVRLLEKNNLLREGTMPQATMFSLEIAFENDATTKGGNE